MIYVTPADSRCKGPWTCFTCGITLAAGKWAAPASMEVVP